MFCDNNGCELLAANTWVILVHRIVLLLYQLFTHYYLFASPTGKEALAISQGRVMDSLRLRRGALVAVLVFTLAVSLDSDESSVVELGDHMPSAGDLWFPKMSTSLIAGCGRCSEGPSRFSQLCAPTCRRHIRL